jgi:hypothetical protein
VRRTAPKSFGTINRLCALHQVEVLGGSADIAAQLGSADHLAELQVSGADGTTACNGLQRLATARNGLQRLATACNGLQRLATACNGLQRLATARNGLQRLATARNGLQRMAA